MTEVVIVQEPVTTVVEVTETEIVVSTETVTETIEVGIAGPQGVTGEQGEQGPQGDPGDDGLDGGNYTHTQAVPASTWTINHGLGYRPGGILVLDTLGRVTVGDVSYPDANTVELTFTAAFSGSAFLS